MVNSFYQGELQSLEELLLFLKGHADSVPEESIIGYGYRQAEAHIISAARNLKSYAQFKSYIDKELTPSLRQVIRSFDGSCLKLTHRLRAQVVKKGWFRILYLIYGR